MPDNSLAFSVLITTYWGERAANLAACLDSIRDQTRTPNEVVLVADGPLPNEQELVIDRFVAAKTVQLKVIRSERNLGRGRARNLGLAACEFALVAVMDSDDLCIRDRFERQIRVFLTKTNVDIVASWQEEFNDVTGIGEMVKQCPEHHDDIVRALKWRNVVPNPSVMFKKPIAVRVGGYGPYKSINEDWDLFVRLILSGAKFYCIQEVLIRVRTSWDQRARRGGWAVIADDFSFRIKHLKSGFFSLGEFILGSIIYLMFRLAPVRLKNAVYKRVRSRLTQPLS